jgi:hypothetical protein
LTPLPAVCPSCSALSWQATCWSAGRSLLYGVPVGPFITERVVYTLYITCDVNLWLFGHSERPFSCRTSPPALPLCWWTGTPLTCLDLTFNPDDTQWLEAVQGIVLRMFLPNPVVILVSNNAGFTAPVAGARRRRAAATAAVEAVRPPRRLSAGPSPIRRLSLPLPLLLSATTRPVRRCRRPPLHQPLRRAMRPNRPAKASEGGAVALLTAADTSGGAAVR